MRVLVTGSTDGIGRETAKRLASMGFDVIVHGRSEKRVEDTVSEISSSFKEIKCGGVTADFTSLKEVRGMAREIISGQLVPDVLINNSGIIMQRFVASVDGYELTFAVNHLAHFCLTLLLLDHLPENARIINVSSMIHSSSVEIENLNDSRHFEGVNAYSWSKLCNVLFTYKLDRILKGERNITVNCLHPGVINTKVLRANWGNIGAPVSEGAKMSVYLAASADVMNISGAYFSGGHKQSSTAASYDEAL